MSVAFEMAYAVASSRQGRRLSRATQASAAQPSLALETMSRVRSTAGVPTRRLTAIVRNARRGHPEVRFDESEAAVVSMATHAYCLKVKCVGNVKQKKIIIIINNK